MRRKEKAMSIVVFGGKCVSKHGDWFKSEPKNEWLPVETIPAKDMAHAARQALRLPKRVRAIAIYETRRGKKYPAYYL